MLVGNWICRAAFNAKVRLRSNFFFSLFGMFFAAITSSSSCWMAVGGSVNTFVGESIAAITKEILAVTALYSSKFLKLCLLVTALSSASYLALALFEKTARCIIFCTTVVMSFWAAMNASTCFSVSLICVTASLAGALIGKLTKATAIGTMVRRSIWYMAEPFTLRSRHPLGLQQRFISRWPKGVHPAIGCSAVLR